MPKKRPIERPKPVGRPKGEDSEVVNVRMPLSMIQRLNRYVDKQEVKTGVSVNHASVIRNVLGKFLKSKKAQA